MGGREASLVDVLLPRVSLGQVGLVRASVQLELSLEHSRRYLRVCGRLVCPSENVKPRQREGAVWYATSAHSFRYSNNIYTVIVLYYFDHV